MGQMIIVLEQLVGAPRFLISPKIKKRFGVNSKAIMDNTPAERVLEILEKNSRIGAVIVDKSCRYTDQEVDLITEVCQRKDIKIARLNATDPDEVKPFLEQ